MSARLWVAAAAMTGLAIASPASAQRVWQNGRWVVMPQQHRTQVMRTGSSHRWAMTNGRWDGGWRAPGGWGAYHRLNRGGSLPGYWRRSDFRIADYLSYGLAAPPPGYFWVRYYDDAVLADGDGRVWDSIDGLSWGGDDAYDGGYDAGYDGGPGAGYPPPRIEPVNPDAYYGDRAGAPYPPPAPVAPIPYPVAPYPQPLPPPAAVQVQTYPGPCAQVCPAANGVYAGNYYSSGAYGAAAVYGGGYAGATTTTVVITPAPVTTTTVVEEVVEEKTVSYVRAAPRRVVHRKPVRRYRPKPACCQCLCR